MDIIGTWKVKKVGIFDEEAGLQMKTLDELMAMEETDEIRETKEMAAATTLVITEEVMQMRLVVPQEAIDEAIAAGEEVPLNEDGTVTAQELPWKIEDGEIYYDTGDEVEIEGELLSSWVKAEFDEDGLFVMGVMALEKV
jgi:hypothetical protein